MLRRADWMVAPCEPARARPLIEALHYAAGAANTVTACSGLWHQATYELAGVAWWMPPTRTAAAAWWPDPEAVLTLSRLVLVPGAPLNAATFLLMRSVKQLDPRWRCLTTYADTWQGHTGHIYRAAGWEYLGLTTPERVYVRNGRMIARKAGPVTRTHAEMLALGAECIGAYPKHRYRYVRPKASRYPIATAQQALWSA